MYSFATFDPRSSLAAQAANDEVFGNPASVLGIEVTIPALAARCGLGNIDPQHTGGDAYTSAIEVARGIPLPQSGATLATVRADMDSIGAMALLSLRDKGTVAPAPVRPGVCPVCTGNVSGMGQCHSCDWDADRYYFSAPAWEGFRNRLKLVAEADRFDRGGWPGVQPLPTRENLWPEAELRSLAAIASAVMDFKVSVTDRVAWMEQWLLTGEEPKGYRARVETEREQTLAALESGATKTATRANGRIATVVSSHRAAIAIGYRMAPVVVALNPALSFQDGPAVVKFTVCQFTGGYVDLEAVADELAALEIEAAKKEDDKEVFRKNNWGGSPNIIGSPQGVSSALTIECVTEIVVKHLKK